MHYFHYILNYTPVQPAIASEVKWQRGNGGLLFEIALIVCWLMPHFSPEEQAFPVCSLACGPENKFIFNNREVGEWDRVWGLKKPKMYEWQAEEKFSLSRMRRIKTKIEWQEASMDNKS